MSSVLRGKTLPLALAFVMAMLTFAEFTFVYKPIADLSKQMLTWALVLAGFASLVAYAMQLQYHTGRIMKKRKGYYWNALVVVMSILYVGIGLIFGVTSPMYVALFYAIPAATSQMMWALQAFFMLGGAYRGFVVRRSEIALFFIAALIMMIYRAPIGPALWDGVPVIGEWLVENLQRTSTRGIVICSSLGAIAIGLRALIGEESGFLKS